MLLDKGEYDEAIKVSSKSIELRPNHDLSYYKRGKAYQAKGDLQKAIKDFNEAVRLDPEYKYYLKTRDNCQQKIDSQEKAKIQTRVDLALADEQKRNAAKLKEFEEAAAQLKKE